LLSILSPSMHAIMLAGMQLNKKEIP